MEAWNLFQMTSDDATSFNVAEPFGFKVFKCSILKMIPIPGQDREYAGASIRLVKVLLETDWNLGGALTQQKGGQ